MSMRRIGILLSKEFFQGPRGFLLIWAIVVPIVLSLVLALIFGTLFSEKPKIGIVDEGSSQLVMLYEELDSVAYRDFSTESGI